MSNGPIKKVLLGDKTIAARWLPYAKTIFTQTEKLGLYTRTVCVDPDNNVTIRVITQGIRSIYIQAEPFIHTFMGWPYDERHPSGWGAPYGSDPETTSYAYDAEDLLFNNPLFAYGKDRSPVNKAVGIAINRDFNPIIQRPSDEKEEVKYGVTNWVSKGGRTIISWDGNPSRHSMEMFNDEQQVSGQSCDFGLWNMGKIGAFYTGGRVCWYEPQPYYPTGGVRRLHGNPWSLDDLEYDVDGNITAYNFNTDNFEYYPAYSNKIYRNGKVIHEVPVEYIVTGASLATVEQETHISAVVAKHDARKGVYREYYYLAKLSGEGSAILLFIGERDYFSLYDPRLSATDVYGNVEDGSSDKLLFWVPWRNTTPWSFDSTGLRAVAIRDKTKDDPQDPDKVCADRRILEFSVSFDYRGNPSLKIEDTDGATPDGYTFESQILNFAYEYWRMKFTGCAYVFSVDFRDDQLVTAQSFTHYHFSMFGNDDAHNWHIEDGIQKCFFVKGKSLLQINPDYTYPLSWSDSYTDLHPASPCYYEPPIIPWVDAVDGDVVTVICEGRISYRKDDYATGGYKFPEAEVDGQECLQEVYNHTTKLPFIYEIDARKLYYFVANEDVLKPHKRSWTSHYVFNDAQNNPKYLRELAPWYPAAHDLTFDVSIEGVSLPVNDLNPVYQPAYEVANSGAIAYPHDGEFFPDVCCPQYIGGFTQVTRGYPSKSGGSAIPFSLYETGSHQSFSSWFTYGDLLFLCICTDASRPSNIFSINRIFAINVTTGTVDYQYKIGELLKLNTDYMGKDVDKGIYPLANQKEYKNSYNPWLPEGGFSNVGVI